MSRALCLAGSLLLMLLAACGRETAPTTSDQLSRRVAFSATAGGPADWRVTYGSPEDADPARAARFVAQTIPPARVQPTGIPGIFRATLGLTGFGGAPLDGSERLAAAAGGQRLPGRGDTTIEGGPHALTVAGRTLEFVPLTPELIDPANLAKPNNLPPGSYTIFAGDALFKSYEGTAAEPVVYTARVAPSFDPQGDPRLDLGGSSFEGFAVLSGERADLGTVTWTPGASLIFDLAARGAPASAGLGMLTLTLELDGRALHTAELQPELEPEPQLVRVTLPADSRSGQLGFRVAGGQGAALVLAPSITRARGAGDARRPDFAIFLADTFRADNLASLGGDPRFTPHMNAFSDAGVHFGRAWAPASWTLPSQASLLTSLPPLRHGAVYELVTLDERYLTLPEVLHEAGWRTIAVTEGGFVVPSFGLDQGFERFVVGPTGDLDRTLANLRAELERDDGRPLFLYFQTFRAHSDYRASAAAMAALPDLFGPDPKPEDWDFRAMMDHVTSDLDDPRAFLSEEGLNGQLRPAIHSHPEMPRFLDLYRGGSFDTDRGFGTFLELLAEFDLGAAHLVLTSDHGESFGEHGIYGHANSVYADCIQVPLVLSFPGQPAASLDTAVSLIDLAPTFLEIADLAVPADWEGLSLMPALAGEPFPHRRLLSFECPSQVAFLPAEVAVHDGLQKLQVSLDAESQPIAGSAVAFDLASDPKEQSPVAAGAWSEALKEALPALLAASTQVIFAPSTRDLDPEAAALLRAMGYLGDAPAPEPAPEPAD